MLYLLCDTCIFYDVYHFESIGEKETYPTAIGVLVDAAFAVHSACHRDLSFLQWLQKDYRKVTLCQLWGSTITSSGV